MAESNSILMFISIEEEIIIKRNLENIINFNKEMNEFYIKIGTSTTRFYDKIPQSTDIKEWINYFNQQNNNELSPIELENIHKNHQKIKEKFQSQQIYKFKHI